MYLSWPVLDSLWSLSYLSTRYSKIARDSLNSNQPSAGDIDRSKRLPNNEVVVVVVDDGGDTTVGVDLQVVGSLLLFLIKVEVHRLVCQPEFFKNDGYFPKSRIGTQTTVRGRD